MSNELIQKKLDECKEKIKKLSQIQYDFEPDKVEKCLLDLFATTAKVQLCFPFEDLDGAKGLFTDAIMPLYHSMPNIERRDTIIISGITDSGNIWVGCCGYYCGTFEKPWLDIPATGHIASLRFHEFYQFENLGHS
jgi:hypothetical protein